MKLSEIIEVFVAGDWGNESQTKDTPYAVSCVRGADIVPIQNDEFRDIPSRYISLRSFENKTSSRRGILLLKNREEAPLKLQGGRFTSQRSCYRLLVLWFAQTFVLPSE